MPQEKCRHLLPSLGSCAFPEHVIFGCGKFGARAGQRLPSFPPYLWLLGRLTTSTEGCFARADVDTGHFLVDGDEVGVGYTATATETRLTRQPTRHPRQRQPLSCPPATQRLRPTSCLLLIASKTTYELIMTFVMAACPCRPRMDLVDRSTALVKDGRDVGSRQARKTCLLLSSGRQGRLAQLDRVVR